MGSSGGSSGGRSFPTFTGSGNPEGVQNATAVGQTYQDTTHGALYFYNGTPPSKTGWIAGVGFDGENLGTGPFQQGAAVSDDGTVIILGDGGAVSNNVVISDVLAETGEHAAIYFNGTGTDGGQWVQFDLIEGSAGGGLASYLFDSFGYGEASIPGAIQQFVLKHQSTSYTMTGAIAVILASAAITLPAPNVQPASGGAQYTIKDDGAGTASVHPHGAETIDGHASISLTAYQSVTVVTDGTNWFTI